MSLGFKMHSLLHISLDVFQPNVMHISETKKEYHKGFTFRFMSDSILSFDLMSVIILSEGVEQWETY